MREGAASGNHRGFLYVGNKTFGGGRWLVDRRGVMSFFFSFLYYRDAPPMRWARWHVGSLFVYDVSTMFPWYHQPAKQHLMFAVSTMYYIGTIHRVCWCSAATNQSLKLL